MVIVPVLVVRCCVCNGQLHLGPPWSEEHEGYRTYCSGCGWVGWLTVFRKEDAGARVGDQGVVSVDSPPSVDLEAAGVGLRDAALPPLWSEVSE